MSRRVVNGHGVQPFLNQLLQVGRALPRREELFRAEANTSGLEQLELNQRRAGKPQRRQCQHGTPRVRPNRWLWVTAGEFEKDGKKPDACIGHRGLMLVANRHRDGAGGVQEGQRGKTIGVYE